MTAVTPTPLAWLVEFENYPAAGSWLDGSGRFSVITELTYQKPEGHYLTCALPIHDAAVLALVSKALGAEEDQEGLLEATTPDELLKAELIGVLVSQAYKTWNATQGSSGANVSDRLPGADTDAPRKKVEGDFLLRDWKVERYGPDRIRVTTPPLGGKVRETHLANRNSLEGDGFFLLANAMLASAVGQPADNSNPMTAIPLASDA